MNIKPITRSPYDAKTVPQNTAVRANNRLPIILEAPLTVIRNSVDVASSELRTDLRETFIDLAIAELQALKNEGNNAAQH